MKKLIFDEKTPNSSMKNIRGGIQGHHAPKINGGRPQGIMHLDSGGDLYLPCGADFYKNN